jgi:hypothetical protein
VFVTATSENKQKLRFCAISAEVVPKLTEFWNNLKSAKKIHKKYCVKQKRRLNYI